MSNFVQQTTEPFLDDSEEDKSSSGFLSTIINITKCFVGAASFELPGAFKNGGLVGSTVGVLFLACLSSFSLGILAECSDLTLQLTEDGKKPIYPNVGLAAAGKLGYGVAWFGVIAMTLGVCGSYFVFVSSTLSDLTGLTQLACLGLTLLVVGLMTLINRLNHLAFASAFGILALVLAVGVATYRASEPREAAISFSDMPLLGDSFGLFLGNAAFLYLISTAILPLRQDTRKAGTFGSALNISIVIVTVLNVFFGLYGWSRFGDTLKGNIIDNLGDDSLDTVVKIFLCIDLVFTSVIFLYPVCQAIESEFGSYLNNVYKRSTARLSFTVSVAVVAYLCPSFSLLTGLTGGFGNNILGFVLPPLFYYRLKQRTNDPVGPVKACFLFFTFCFGLFFLVFSTYSVIDSLLKA